MKWNRSRKKKVEPLQGPKRGWLKWISILVAAVLLLSVSFAPKLIFAVQDRALFSTPKDISAAPGSLSTEAADIYLVKAIHHMYEQGYKDHFSFLYNTQDYYRQMQETMFEQLKLMNEGSIIDKQLFYHILDTMESVTPFVSTDRRTAGGSYIEREMLSIPYDGGAMWLQMEPKTGKLLSVTMGSAGTISALYDEALTKQVMEDYVKYLGLDVLDDWTYLKPYYISQKAQLQISAYNNTQMEIVPLNFLKAE